MAVLNLILRQEVADRINAGQGDAQIRNETGFAQVKSIRELVALGLPMSTRIRKDGTINEEPRVVRPEKGTEEYQAFNREYHKNRNAKLKAAGVARLKDLGGEQPPPDVADPPQKKQGKVPNYGEIISSQAKEFSYAWEILLNRQDWTTQEESKASVVRELKNLRALTGQLIKRTEGEGQ